jgi:hypothetical protein
LTFGLVVDVDVLFVDVVVDFDGDGDGDVAVDDRLLPRPALRGDASWVVCKGRSDPFTATSHVAVAVHAHDHVNEKHVNVNDTST